jgi:hypothetical protein
MRTGSKCSWLPGLSGLTLKSVAPARLAQGSRVIADPSDITTASTLAGLLQSTPDLTQLDASDNQLDDIGENHRDLRLNEATIWLIGELGGLEI